MDLSATVHTLTTAIVGGASGLSIDNMGIVYAGTFDDRVYKVRMDGRPEVFASGLYGATGNAVGPRGNRYPLDATFNSPNGIAATGEGKVFVHDINPRAESDGVTVDLRNGSLRVVSLPSLTGELSDMYVAEGAEAMVEAYNRNRADPATAWLLDEAEMMGWGKVTLPVLPKAGLRIFQLNVESYPSSWRAQEALGDAYVTVGQPAKPSLPSSGRSSSIPTTRVPPRRSNRYGSLDPAEAESRFRGTLAPPPSLDRDETLQLLYPVLDENQLGRVACVVDPALDHEEPRAVG